MNKFKKIFFCIASVCIILVSMCPISASAAQPQSFYNFSCQKPEVTVNSGYFEILYSDADYGYFNPVVYSWSFTPTVSSDTPHSVSTELNIHLSRNSSDLTLSVITDGGCSGFLSLTVYYLSGAVVFNNYYVTSTDATVVNIPAPTSSSSIAGIHWYGSYNSIGNMNSYSELDFFITYGADSVITTELTHVLTGIQLIIELLQNQTDIDYSSEFSYILSALSSLNNTSSNFHTEFSSLMNQLLSLYNNSLTDLKSIITNTEDMEYWLSVLHDGNVAVFDSVEDIKDFMYAFDTYLSEMRGMFDNLYWLQLDSNGILYEINGKLDTIISLLQAFSDEDFTEFDDSILDDYLDSEESLLDDSNVSTDVFDVEINPDAMASVFDIFDTVLNVHPKIIGFIIAVLSLGLIALILGR